MSTPTEVAMFQNIANPGKIATSPRSSMADGAGGESFDLNEDAQSEFSNMFAEARSHLPDSPPHDGASTFSMGDAAPLPRTTDSQPAPPSGSVPQQPFDYEPERPDLGRAAHDDEDVALEKQAVLLEIDDLRSQGMNITKQFSMDDSLESMQFEVRRHLAHVDEVRMVAMLTDMFKMGLTGFEMGSKKFNFLDLDGYSAEVASDMSRFTPAITRLYRKYYRRSVWSPEAELGFALCSSMAMFHFRKKFYDGTGSSGGGGGGGGGAMPNPFGFAAGAAPQPNPPPTEAAWSDAGSDEQPPPSFL